MQISMWVPYDEQRLRRSARFVLRSSMTRLRVATLVVALSGAAVMLLTDLGSPTLLGATIAAACVALVMEPVAVRQVVRTQGAVMRPGYQMTLDDAGVEMRGAAFTTRFGWPALERIVEQPDAWYLMFGKMQTMVVYKEFLTPEQGAEFSAFLSWPQPA
ncbi:YcxB family protein [Saccharothrix hoggarensis]|uniref:YcxB family protein n=1 Tax=Saccharothrix hoggarensis TaxID=913853 RepID=A0ABW3QYL5_9PSEU